MATIFYGVSGEGRGHATRARTLIEALGAEHRVVVYAYGQAHELLAPLCRDGSVKLRRIPGLRFRYQRNGRLAYARTLAAAVPYLAGLSRLVDRIRADIEVEQPTLAITDFEPALPRAAVRSGLPFISLDHQHFLLAFDLRGLPARLRRYAQLMAPFVRAYCRGQARTVVSSFYSAPINPAFGAATRIGVLLRSEVLGASVRAGKHLVAYVRRSAHGRTLDVLREAGVPVHVYGLGAHPSTGNVCFRAIDPTAFVEDLATSRALVTTAGNQVVGEALYLRKPVLALPEPGNREQEINAHFLARSRMGHAIGSGELSAGALRDFLDDLGPLRERIQDDADAGNTAALGIVRHHVRLAELGLPPTQENIPPCAGHSRSRGRLGPLGGVRPAPRGF